MALWVRFEVTGKVGFGQLEGARILIYCGDICDGAAATGETLALEAVKPMIP